MMRIKAPELSIPGTPHSEKSAVATPPNELSEKLYSALSSPSSPKTLNQTQLAESLRRSLTETQSPPSPKPSSGSQSMLFSGMELPDSLLSFLSQSQPDLVKKRTGVSPKRVPRSPKKRKNSLSLAVVEPKTAIEWDDDELVLYGQEKVFSFSGYQLHMGSLLGLLYAASRVLQLPFFARDFEL